jgi:8-oxo-dGTP pyrophosphatase MutT (NUDIX family)
MPIEKSAGAVIFYKDNVSKGIFYLLLHYPNISHRADKDYWDLPKGHLERGETSEEAARREVKEETGLDIEILPNFKETIRYFFRWEGKNVLKFVTFFWAETKSKEVEISDEHIGFEWLPFEEAVAKVAFKNAKEMIKKANNYLNKKPR